MGPEQYVSVTARDLDGMKAQTEQRFVRRVGDRLFLKMVHGRCAALRARQGHFSCRIYAQRPAVCHVVEAGSRECLTARKRHGYAEAAS